MKKYLLLKFVFIVATFTSANAQIPYYYNNFGTQGYSYGLKKHIELGQHNSTTASVLVNNGQNVSLRAVDYILLDDGFEVTDDEGTEFFATTNGTCDN